MPVELAKIQKLEQEERERKLRPRLSRRQKDKITQSLTHWVILDIHGKQYGGLFKTKADYETYLFVHNEIYEKGPPRIQKLICHPSITCKCSENSPFFKYSGHNIIYKCRLDHKTIISEYD